MEEPGKALNRQVRELIGGLMVDKMELQLALAQARAEIEKLKPKDQEPQ